MKSAGPGNLRRGPSPYSLHARFATDHAANRQDVGQRTGQSNQHHSPGCSHGSLCRTRVHTSSVCVKEECANGADYQVDAAQTATNWIDSFCGLVQLILVAKCRGERADPCLERPERVGGCLVMTVHRDGRGRSAHHIDEP